MFHKWRQSVLCWHDFIFHLLPVLGRNTSVALNHVDKYLIWLWHLRYQTYSVTFTEQSNKSSQAIIREVWNRFFFLTYRGIQIMMIFLSIHCGWCYAGLWFILREMQTKWVLHTSSTAQHDVHLLWIFWCSPSQHNETVNYNLIGGGGRVIDCPIVAVTDRVNQTVSMCLPLKL